MSQSQDMEGPSKSDLRSMLSGPTWVTDYVLNIHHYYLNSGKTMPTTFTKQQIDSFNIKGTHKQMTIDITPIIEAANKAAKLHFYPSIKDKNQVLDIYEEWFHHKHEKLLTIKIPTSTGRSNTIRVSEHLSPKRSKNSFHTTFILDQIRGWLRVLDDDDDGLPEECFWGSGDDKFDKHGNFVDQAEENKNTKGKEFRESKKGEGFFRWMTTFNSGEDPEMNPWMAATEDEITTSDCCDIVNDETGDLEDDGHGELDMEPLTTATMSAKRDTRFSWSTVFQHASSLTELAPIDSASKGGNWSWNIRAVIDEEGWEDDLEDDNDWEKPTVGEFTVW